MQPLTSPDLATLALTDAKKSRMEAPWYGFYSVVLSSLSHLNPKRKSATLIYPQLTVRFQESLEIEELEDDVGSEDESYSTDTSQLPIPVPAIKGQLPELTPEPSTPDHRKTQFAEASPVGGSDAAKLSAKEYKRIISQRTPDFCRRRYYLDDQGRQFADRLDLLVEIKKWVPEANEDQIYTAKKRVFVQMKTQALFAFVEDLQLSKIICLGAIGPQWFYFLLQRPPTMEELMEELYRGGHPRPALGESPYVPSDRGSLPVTPISKRPGTSRLLDSASSSSPDQLGSSVKATFPVPRRGTDVPKILKEGTFKHPSSGEEKKWIRDLKKKLDEVDKDIAKPYLESHRATLPGGRETTLEAANLSDGSRDEEGRELTEKEEEIGKGRKGKQGDSEGRRKGKGKEGKIALGRGTGTNLKSHDPINILEDPDQDWEGNRRVNTK